MWKFLKSLFVEEGVDENRETAYSMGIIPLLLFLSAAMLFVYGAFVSLHA